MRRRARAGARRVRAARSDGARLARMGAPAEREGGGRRTGTTQSRACQGRSSQRCSQLSCSSELDRSARRAPSETARGVEATRRCASLHVSRAVCLRPALAMQLGGALSGRLGPSQLVFASSRAGSAHATRKGSVGTATAGEQLAVAVPPSSAQQQHDDQEAAQRRAHPVARRPAAGGSIPTSARAGARRAAKWQPECSARALLVVAHRRCARARLLRLLFRRRRGVRAAAAAQHRSQLRAKQCSILL